ncbi:TPA: hypothetical protein N0F65_003871 [Lagenidium giganteum]|uniref:Uncharacterized protein n=1 Tax=Lagenidium giganteum TaxID=4803 RepID=A0AAV2ZA25_9STRA|nr:TPA: hypothetical protein N0F65_003871 [Lagenidium giganteum]
MTFAEPTDAEYAKQTIEVDEELQPEKIERVLSVDGNTLIAYVFHCVFHCEIDVLNRVARLVCDWPWCCHRKFRATEVRLLRAAVSSYYDMTLLAARTLLEFKE